MIPYPDISCKKIGSRDNNGKTIGSKRALKPIKGVLGPGPGGYDVEKIKRGNLSFS